MIPSVAFSARTPYRNALRRWVASRNYPAHLCTA